MKQADFDADAALAYIRYNTAAPIQRFLDSVVATRREEAAHCRTGRAAERATPWPSRLGQRLKRMF